MPMMSTSSVAGLAITLSCVWAVSQPEFDCPARVLAWDRATRLLGPSSLAGGLPAVHEALQLDSACGIPTPAVAAPPVLPAWPRSRLATLHISPDGDDTSADGSTDRPYGSLEAARDAARVANRVGPTVGTLALASGRYVLERPVRLGPADNGLTIEAAGNGPVVISGGLPVSLQLEPVPAALAAATGLPREVMRATLPRGLGSALSSLYEDQDAADPRTGCRLPWAREPNGEMERDLQPTGMARAQGEGSTPAGPGLAGAVHLELTTPLRNDSVYPMFGRDFDPRDVRDGKVVGWQWYHVGGSSDRFADRSGFWNGTAPTSMKYGDSNESIGDECQVTAGGQCRRFSPFRGASRWTTAGAAGGVAHVFHNAYWGNWQLQLSTVNATDSEMLFSRGGFQEGHGGTIGTQPFFVEGVREALDARGEWWVDRSSDTLYIYPNTTLEIGQELRLIAPRLQQLLVIQGFSGEWVRNITLRGLTFAHTSPTYFEPYTVPSPGDWSVHAGGAVTIQSAEDTTVDQCAFIRLGGNALAILGHAWRSTVSTSEFVLIGDSAIITVGDLQLNDGVSSSDYPLDTSIVGSHFHEIGVTGKQTAALFSATSCRTRFANNTAYNGPRAALNLNDGFCHGHTIEFNLLFNWVRETQDHGPINSWNRAAYVHSSRDGAITSVPEWTHINANLIMNGPTIGHTSSLFPAVDNDDGSAFFSISGNVMLYGGGKNYLGHDKRWVGNLILFPDRWAGDPCVMIWGGESHVFESNECVLGNGSGTGDNSPSPVPALPDPVGLDGTRSGAKCRLDFSHNTTAAMVGLLANNSYWTQDGLWSFGCGNATSDQHRWTMRELEQAQGTRPSVVNRADLLTAEALDSKARSLLGMAL